MEDKVTNFLLGALTVLLFVCVFFIGFNVHGFLETLPKAKVVDSSFNCSKYNISNGNLFNKAACLHNQVESFYRYNISNVDRTLTVEELKREGGVCWHYADYYLQQAQQLGLYAKEFKIQSGNDSNHAFTVISNEQGYCVMDQNNTNCWEFK